jgi:hypothetical protein
MHTVKKVVGVFVRFSCAASIVQVQLSCVGVMQHSLVVISWLQLGAAAYGGTRSFGTFSLDRMHAYGAWTFTWALDCHAA